jgi:CheY-like chemotaxis protein
MKDQPRVLVVDGAPTSLDSASHLLQLAGHQVLEATNAEQGQRF